MHVLSIWGILSELFANLRHSKRQLYQVLKKIVHIHKRNKTLPKFMFIQLLLPKFMFIRLLLEFLTWYEQLKDDFVSEVSCI